MHLGWSSCVYPLEADDFAAVPDYDGEPVPAADLPDDQRADVIAPDMAWVERAVF